MALLYEEQIHDFDNAEDYYVLSLDIKNNNPATTNLALLLLEQKKYTTSLIYFKKAIKEHYNFDIIYYYIQALYSLDMYDKAMDMLVKYNMFKDSDDDIKELFIKIVDIFVFE